jgi:hypothetical protein
MEHLAHLLDGCSDVGWPARLEGLAEEHFGQRDGFVGAQVEVRERAQEICSALLGELICNAG